MASDAIAAESHPDTLIAPALLPVAWLYQGIITLRNQMYDRRIIHAARATIPVVSIGNITVGGTGKTPHVIEIAQRLIALGARPAIVTRGYRGTTEQPADEVLELRAALPQVQTIVSPDRVRGAREAAARNATCVILDDGFQHRRLGRDLDIVLIDAIRPWGGGALLPAGRLREPPSSLRRSHLIVISRANQVDRSDVEAVHSQLSAVAPNTPVVESCVEPAQVVDANRRIVSPDDLRDARIMLVAGLGNAATVAHSIRTLPGGRPLAFVREFPDHHAYNASDVARIMREAGAVRADVVITTRKDWVKLMPLWPRDEQTRGIPRLLRLDIRVAIRDARDEVNRLLSKVLETRR
ncbi:MAG: tetraacyldisaccharide 4'-kinase [Phycisphaerales bacterium]|nr:tetraacyldisaccharide 4'-kinase [Phycisphaerales bacterium]